MSRSGYSCDGGWSLICWRGAVKSAIRGKRGQAFLKELLAALDAMPEKVLIREQLQADGQFCTLGVVGHARGLDMEQLDPYDYDQVAGAFNISQALAREIEFINDEYAWHTEDPGERWRRVRNWVEQQIKKEESADV